ncbi:MAG: DUF433 domain-containing protein [Gaiellaceae bacterium]
MARGEIRAGETPSSHQFSIRVSAPTFESLERRRQELDESRNALVERYIAEGVQMDEHPEIYFRAGALGRRAALIGTRLDVWQVMETVRNSGNSVAQAAEYLNLSPAKVEAAVRYYAVNKEEVDRVADREIAASDRVEAAWRAGKEILVS